MTLFITQDTQTTLLYSHSLVQTMTYSVLHSVRWTSSDLEVRQTTA